MALLSCIADDRTASSEEKQLAEEEEGAYRFYERGLFSAARYAWQCRTIANALQ